MRLCEQGGGNAIILVNQFLIFRVGGARISHNECHEPVISAIELSHVAAMQGIQDKIL